MESKCRLVSTLRLGATIIAGLTYLNSKELKGKVKLDIVSITKRLWAQSMVSTYLEINFLRVFLTLKLGSRGLYKECKAFAIL